MFSIFKSAPKKAAPLLTVDIHSHLLAGLDDGVKSLDEAWQVVRRFEDLGYQKLITTPHVMQDYYRNTPPAIYARQSELRDFLRQQNCVLQLEAAAEYYLDETLMQSVIQQETLLTFGTPKYLLFETNVFAEPYQLNDFIFKLSIQRYKPVLAHPERYEYLNGKLSKLEDLRSRGVLFQLNLLSLVGLYSKSIQKMAEKMIDMKWVDFIGSDCHNVHHSSLIEKAQQTRYFKKAMELPLLNNSLL